MAVERPTKKYRNLLFDVRRSVRYHDRRQRFYQKVQNFAIFIVLLFSMATVATFGAEVGQELPVWVKLLPAVLTAVLMGLTLVYRIDEKAWLHADLKRRFIELEQHLEQRHATCNGQLIAEVTNKRLEIEVTEPPVLRVLDVLCHNELMRAMGYPRERLVPVGFWQRLFAPFFDFREHLLDLHPTGQQAL